MTDAQRKQRAHWFSSEMLTAHRFAKEGYNISLPFVPTRYDLIVDTGEKLYRIQVKRAHFREQRNRPNGRGERECYAVVLDRHLSSGHKRLGVDEFDFVSVVCTDMEMYLIPIAELHSLRGDGKTLKSVRIKFPENCPDRNDARKAAQRWEKYRNNYRIDG